MVFKRPLTVLIFSIEVGVIFVLCVLLYRYIRNVNESISHIIHLEKDSYQPILKSQRFPHYFEPKPYELINDHPEWLGYNVSYSINADSLNERSDYPTQRIPDTYRIVTLGDSFTYGLFVNTYENYSERLEDMLNTQVCSPIRKYEVINLGVPAYDIGYSAERFQLRGQKYIPDLVVWFINPFTFDIDADRRMALEDEYLRKIPESEHWRLKNGKPVYYPGLLAWQQMGREISIDQAAIKQAQYFREFLTTYQGALLIVANESDLWNPLAITALEEALGRREKYWIYRLDRLEPQGGLLADGHPNVSGHKRIASDIYTYLRDHSLLPCEQPAP